MNCTVVLTVENTNCCSSRIHLDSLHITLHYKCGCCGFLLHFQCFLCIQNYHSERCTHNSLCSHFFKNLSVNTRVAFHFSDGWMKRPDGSHSHLSFFYNTYFSKIYFNTLIVHEKNSILYFRCGAHHLVLLSGHRHPFTPFLWTVKKRQVLGACDSAVE